MSYLDRLADRIRAHVPLDALPDGDTASLFLIYAVLLLAKGVEVTNEDVHNAWVAWMEIGGQEHPSMRPFAELPAETQAEDSPYATAIRQVARGEM